eukprot:COSAG02_NODE_28626_length_586_cov_0.628337_2_plen_30_part_01
MVEAIQGRAGGEVESAGESIYPARPKEGVS